MSLTDSHIHWIVIRGYFFLFVQLCDKRREKKSKNNSTLDLLKWKWLRVFSTYLQVTMKILFKSYDEFEKEKKNPYIFRVHNSKIMC